MTIGILLLGTLIESLLLYWIRKSRWLIFPLLILFGFLLFFLFILPPFFTPEPPMDDDIRCGMPIVATTLIFWGYGITSTICVGVVFFGIKSKG